MHESNSVDSRRRLLRFLLESPLLYGLGAGLGFSRGLLAQPPGQNDAVLSGSLEWNELIKTADEALNVFDFEPVLRSKISAAHYAYMAQGADDMGRIAANRAGFEKIALRPRRLVDVSQIDMSVELFGTRYDAPIFLSPVGAQVTFHPEGEVAAARGAKAENALQSTIESLPEVLDAVRGRAPVFVDSGFRL